MKTTNLIIDNEALERRLSEQLFLHRKKMKLGQVRVALMLNVGCSTYQRWESTGKGLTNIHTMLEVFQALNFSTPEIIDTLGLPPLTLDELKDLELKECIQEGIGRANICSYVKTYCSDMDDSSIEGLLDILFAERIKRHYCK